MYTITEARESISSTKKETAVGKKARGEREKERGFSLKFTNIEILKKNRRWRENESH